MKKKLFYELCKLDLFESEEDRWDLIEDVYPFLVENNIKKALNETVVWFEDVYDGLDSKCEEIPIDTIYNTFEKIYKLVLSSVSEEDVINLLEKYNVDKTFVIENIFAEEEINEAIAQRISERNWSIEEVKDLFGIEN